MLATATITPTQKIPAAEEITIDLCKRLTGFSAAIRRPHPHLAVMALLLCKSIETRFLVSSGAPRRDVEDHWTLLL
jgi:hypothetical protein